MVHTLVVDDHHLFREGIRLILADVAPESRFTTAGDCESALDIPAHDVDLVLLDYHLPGTSGTDALGRIRDHFRHAAIVVVSGEQDGATIRRVIDAGAAGFIPKSASPEVLFAALELVTAGGCYLPPHALDETPETPRERVSSLVENLTERQRAVLARAIQGKINKVIADELNVAEGTVKAHLSAAYRVLGVANRAEAVYVVTRNEILLDPGSGAS